MGVDVKDNMAHLASPTERKLAPQFPGDNQSFETTKSELNSTKSELNYGTAASEQPQSLKDPLVLKGPRSELHITAGLAGADDPSSRDAECSLREKHACVSGNEQSCKNQQDSFSTPRDAESKRSQNSKGSQNPQTGIFYSDLYEIRARGKQSPTTRKTVEGDGSETERVNQPWVPGGELIERASQFGIVYEKIKTGAQFKQTKEKLLNFNYFDYFRNYENREGVFIFSHKVVKD